MFDNNILPFLMTFMPAFFYTCILYFTFFRDVVNFKMTFLYFMLGALSTTALLTFHWILPWWNVYWHPDFIIAVGWLAFVQVALTEESVKMLFYKFASMYKKKKPNNMAIIFYTLSVSLGFAAVENITYVWKMGPAVLLSRSISAVILHTLTGIMMGYFIVLSKYKYKTLCWFLALLIPAAFHGIYDFNIMVAQKYIETFNSVIDTGLGIHWAGIIIPGILIAAGMLFHIKKLTIRKSKPSLPE